jgi:dienelactone hydrolase
MNIFRQHWSALCLILIGVAGLVLYSLTRPDIVVKEEIVASSSGNPIRIRLVEPAFQNVPPNQQHPAVIAIPPYNIPADVMHILCSEFAQRGVACAIPDFFGKAPQESRQNMGHDSLDIMTQDVLSIAEFLRGLPWIDSEKIGVCGHSVGGTVAFLAGIEDPEIRAVVPIGMETEMPLRQPQNLLLLAGLYDEIRTPRALLKRLAEYQLATVPQFYTLYGDFTDGTARQVSISPTSDHFIEPMDPWIIRQLLRWHALAFEQSEPGQEHLTANTTDFSKSPFALSLSKGLSASGSTSSPQAEGLTSRPLHLTAWWHTVSEFFIIIAITVFYAWGVIRICLYPAILTWSARQPLWLKLRIHILPLCICLVLFWWAGNAIQIIRSFAPHFMTSFVVAHLCISMRIRHMAERQGGKSVRPLHPLGSVLLALGAAFFLTCFLVNLSFFVPFPGALVRYPVFVLNMLILFPLQLWLRLVVAIFSETMTACTPNIWYWATLLGMIIVLDWPIRLLNRIAERCIVACQKEFRWYDTSFSTLKWIGFAIVWGVFGVLAYRRMAEGMLTAETVEAGLGLLLRLILLPGLIFWLLVRFRHKYNI